MTTIEMINSFNVIAGEYQGLPSLKTIDVVEWLNNAVIEYVIQNYVKQGDMGFEINEYNMNKLRTIEEYAELAPETSGIGFKKSNSYVMSLPDTYWISFQEEAKISVRGVEKRVSIQSITHDQYTSMIKDPFNKPEGDYIFRLSFQDYVEILCGSDITVVTYYLRYIRKPNKLDLSTPSVSCELPDIVHFDIVKLAVQMYANTINNKNNNK